MLVYATSSRFNDWTVVGVNYLLTPKVQSKPTGDGVEARYDRPMPIAYCVEPSIANIFIIS